MEYNNYLKYKNKYLQLKNKQVGGDKTFFLLEIPLPGNNCIVLSYYYDKKHSTRFYYLITEFSIMYNNNPIKLIYNTFYVNDNFFNDFLDLDINKYQELIKSDQPNELKYKDKIRNINNRINEYKKRDSNIYDFKNCEEREIQDDYLIVAHGNDNIKRFIESYFRKNFCIVINSHSIMGTEIAKFHNIMKLYFDLVTIHHYFKIELIKHYEPGDLSRYEYIYREIPKYIESDIATDKIKFEIEADFKKLSELPDNNGISGKDLNIIFDTGNSSVTFVSNKFLNFIGYYNRIEPNPALLNKKIFKSFIMPGVIGVGGKKSKQKITELILLKFKFIDQKLMNEKEYKIFCFRNDKAQADILLGQNTLQQLYNDGYSIKWRKSAIVGKKQITDILGKHAKLNNNIKTLVAQINLGNLDDPKKISELRNDIIEFLHASYLEMSELSIDEIKNNIDEIKNFINNMNNNKNFQSAAPIFYNGLDKTLFEDILK